MSLDDDDDDDDGCDEENYEVHETIVDDDKYASDIILMRHFVGPSFPH